MDRALLAGTAAIAASACVYVFILARTAFDQDLRKVPGPLLSRWTNLPLKWQVLTGRRAHHIHALHQRYGPVVRIAPTEIAFADITAFQAIHRVGSQFTKAPWYQNQQATQHDDATCGVFGLRDPKIASARRRLFQQAGTKAAVLQWEPTIVQIVRLTVEKIKQDALRGKADIVKWWELMATDVLGSLAFGEPFRLVENGKKTQLVEDIDNSMIIGGIHAELPLLHDLIIDVPLPGIGKPRDFLRRYAEYGYVAVKNTKTPKGGAKTLFSKMYPEDGSQPISDSLMAAESANIIVAGGGTTATALIYLVYAVLSNPKVKQTLLEELATCSAVPGWEELEMLPYLNRVITETLRWQPPIAGSLPRVVPAEGATLAGFRIPGGTTVDTQAYTFHRDPVVWKDPQRFNPDRWEHPTPEMKECFMPWGGMSRVCLGQNVARLELLHAVATFFRECPTARLADSVTPKSMEFVDYFATRPVGGKCEVTML